MNDDVELDAIRRRLDETAWGYPSDGARPFVASLVGAVALGGPAVLAGVLAVAALLTGSPAVAAFFAVVAALTGIPAVALARRVAPRQRAVAAERESLLQRDRELLQNEAPSARSPQPSPYARMMWSRFRLGPSPDDALRRLPPDAPAWRVAFHRRVGWGVVAAVTLAVLTLALYAVLTSGR